MAARQGSQARRRASVALAVLGAALALIGGFLLYARQELFDPDQLAERSKGALGDERLRLAIAQPIVDGILDEGPVKLVNARPLIESVVVAVLGTPPAKAAVAEAVKTVDAKLFEQSPNTLLLNLTDSAVIAAGALAAVSPKLGSAVPKQLDAVKVAVLESDFSITSLSFAGDLRLLGLLLPALALLSLVASVAIDRDRRRAVQRAAALVAGSAAVGLVLLIVARALVLAQFDDPLVHDAVAAIWEALFSDLVVWVVAIGLLALILAAASRFGGTEVDPLAPLLRASELLRRRPANPALGVLRGLGFALVGIALVAQPVLSLSVLAVFAGAWLLYVAVVELLAILAPPLPAVAGRPLRRRLRPLRVAGAVAVAALVAVVVVATGDSQSQARPPGPPEACNGYAELCSKRLDEVTFPATHNSMSAAEEPGWFVPNQRFGITRQLDDGIRGLLIDTHYGIRRGSGRGFGQVITDLDQEGKTRGEVVAELGEETVQKAEELVGRLAFDGAKGTAEPFLCHVLCELGATDLDDGLAAIDDWMASHPDEFLVIFIEDVVSPAETADAFERSGLLRYAYVPDPALPSPTLGELIEKDERLLVMAENDGGHGKYPWYVEGFELVQETPFTFESAAEMASPAGCRPNRGSVDNPLFQINNWIETIPRDPDLAGRVNSSRALLARARLCARERGLEPNIIAVDYYDRGDVLAVANVLNGLAADAVPEVRTLP